MNNLINVLALGSAIGAACVSPLNAAGPPMDTQATNDVNRSLSARPQSPAAEDVRKIIAQTTSAVVQGKFEDAQKRFCEADRKRLGWDFNNSSTLRDHFSQFEKDWKARYNEDFTTDNIERALADSNVKVYEGDLADCAQLASARVEPNQPDSSRDDNANAPKEPAALNKDAATVQFTGAPNAGVTVVVLRKEGGIGNTWRIDVPDKLDVPKLENNLSMQVTAIEEAKGSWPADVNDAYRMITQRVLMALHEQPIADGRNSDRPGEPASPR